MVVNPRLPGLRQSMGFTLCKRSRHIFLLYRTAAARSAGQTPDPKHLKTVEEERVDPDFKVHGMLIAIHVMNQGSAASHVESAVRVKGAIYGGEFQNECVQKRQQADDRPPFR